MMPDTKTTLANVDSNIRRCGYGCGNDATNQAVYERQDGSHFLGDTVCDDHRYPIGPLAHASARIVDHMEVSR